ncbi:MAG: Crp/Fnr family transcriptional regulator [Actinomycetota bacterium]
MNPTNAASLLGRTHLFGGLREETLMRLADRARARSYRKGQPVFHQGDLGDSLFMVIEGLVKVYVTSEDGDEMVLVTLRPPEIFGELALIDGGARSASAEALERTTLLCITRPSLLDVAVDDRSLTEALLRSMGATIRRLTEQASDLVFLDLHGRVAKLLLGMAEGHSHEADEGRVLDLQMTQSDLAGMVGGSRQSVNQILRTFERRGYLDVRGRKVVLKHPELLRRRAGL